MNVVAFDTETKGLDWFNPDQQAFLGTWATGDGEWHAVLSDPAEGAAFLSALSRADVIVAHNLSFDAHQVRETLGLDILSLGKTLHDTDLMSRVLFPEGQRKDRGGHGLKNLAKVYLRQDAGDAEDHIKEMGKAIGLRTLKKAGAYYDVWRAYPEVMERYARLDARFTYDIYQDFLPRLEEQPALKRLYEMEMEVCQLLIQAERIGTRVDPEAVARLKALYLEKKREEEEYLDRELGGREVYEGEGSEDALEEALLKLGVPLTERTDGGKLSVAKPALGKFEQQFPVIQHLFEWRRVNKFLSTYIAPMEDTEVVHPSFMQAEAWTGRMSCRRPNMQNIPKRRDLSDEANEKVRSMFIPRAGHSFVVSDFAGIEDRFLAYYCGVQESRDVITAGRDPHAYTAAVVWGGEAADFDKKGPKAKIRDRTKHARYAMTYGAGAPKVMHTVNSMLDPDETPITLAQSRAIVARIKQSIPGYKALNKRIRNKIESEGHVTTIMGRKQVVNPDKSYVGLNALIQGGAADAMKLAMVETARRFKEAGLDATILLVVHDELLTECPTIEEELVASIQTEAMESVLPQLDPRLKVETTITRESYAHAK